MDTPKFRSYVPDPLPVEPNPDIEATKRNFRIQLGLVKPPPDNSTHYKQCPKCNMTFSLSSKFCDQDTTELSLEERPPIPKGSRA